jgi:hypothetical protein
VELGMIAGALVNQRDIHRGLFTPDVKMPAEVPTGERSVFFNAVPMAASTEGEMMASSSDPRFCHQRVHVTGGTNGILVESLRRHRPFTPTFIGRAEDQAYLMSVLYSGSAPFLRYLHEPGLIMRHDKEAFAGASIAAAAHGRLVGDLVRTLLFSRYAELLPWGFDATKAELDPFTGAFITRRATTVVFLRLALKCAELVAAGRAEEAENLLDIARQKLSPLMTADAVEAQGEAVTRQRRGWNRFYDLLDRAESATPGGEAADRVVNRAAREVRTIVESARIC